MIKQNLKRVSTVSKIVFLLSFFAPTLRAQDILIYEAKFETDAQGWTWQAYNAGSPFSLVAGRIFGVNWPLHGGTEGCIRHNSVFGVQFGSWFARSPAIQLEAGKQYYVKFGVTKSGHTPADNSRVQARIGTSANANGFGNTIVLPSQVLPASTVNVAGYLEYTSQDLFTATITGNHYVNLADFFNNNSHAVYYDGIRVYEVNNAPLPVTLTSFNAQCEPQQVILSWTTASEYKASHFDVEMSRDGLTWNNIGQVAAVGTTNQTTNYQFNAPNAGLLSYFRLVQVDLDGASEIYGPISSACHFDKNSIGISPNPASESFKIEIHSTARIENAEILLVNMMGTTVFRRREKLNKGSNQLLFKPDLPPGTYAVLVSSEQGSFEKTKLVIQ